MSRPTRVQLARFMESVLGWLGQPRWLVHLTDDKEDHEDDVWAWTRYNGQRYSVVLWISDHIVEKADSRTQRLIMVHEALHAIHVRIDSVVWDQEDMMHDYEYKRLETSYHRERELMVDGLSMAIVDVPEIKRLWREAMDG